MGNARYATPPSACSGSSLGPTRYGDALTFAGFGRLELRFNLHRRVHPRRFVFEVFDIFVVVLVLRGR